MVYAGRSVCLPGLDAALVVHLHDDMVIPFTTGTATGGGISDLTMLLAQGAALQVQGRMWDDILY